jgi:hypothetical protein
MTGLEKAWLIAGVGGVIGISLRRLVCPHAYRGVAGPVHEPSLRPMVGSPGDWPEAGVEENSYKTVTRYASGSGSAYDWKSRRSLMTSMSTSWKEQVVVLRKRYQYTCRCVFCLFVWYEIEVVDSQTFEMPYPQ